MTTRYTEADVARARTEGVRYGLAMSVTLVDQFALAAKNRPANQIERDSAVRELVAVSVTLRELVDGFDGECHEFE